MLSPTRMRSILVAALFTSARATSVVRVAIAMACETSASSVAIVPLTLWVS